MRNNEKKREWIRQPLGSRLPTSGLKEVSTKSSSSKESNSKGNSVKGTSVSTFTSNGSLPSERALLPNYMISLMAKDEKQSNGRSHAPSNNTSTVSRKKVTIMDNQNESNSVNEMMYKAQQLLVPRAIFNCEEKSHPFVRREVLLNHVVKIGRDVVGSKPASDNCIFDCPVLSRNHAIFYYKNRKFLLKDTKSSNGTFLNEKRLSNCGEESAEFEVFSGDTIRLGIDITQANSEAVHPAIIMTVTLYHLDGTEALKDRPYQLGYDKTSLNVSTQQLLDLAQYIEMADFREVHLHLKLKYLEQQLEQAEKMIQDCWKSAAKEDLLLSKVETLHGKLQTLMTCLQADKKENVNEQVAMLRNDLTTLHDDKEAYEKAAKETIMGLYEERLKNQNSIYEAEARLTSAEIERKRLQAFLEELQKALKESSEKNCQQIAELESSSQKLFDLNSKIVQINLEKMDVEQKLLEFQMRESSLQEQITDLKAELEEKHLELESVSAYRDALNCTNELEKSIGLENSKSSENLEEQVISQSTNLNTFSQNSCPSHLKELEFIKQSMEEIQNSKKKLEENVEDLEKSNQNLLSKNEELTKKKTLLEEKITELQKLLTGIENDHSKMTQEKDIYLKELEDKILELDFTQKNLEDELQQEKEKVGEKEARIEKLTQETIQLSSVLTSCEQKSKTLEDDLAKAKEELKSQENKLKEQTKLLSELSEKMIDLQKDNQNLLAQVTAREVLESVIDKLEADESICLKQYMQSTDNSTVEKEINTLQNAEVKPKISIENENLKAELRSLREEFELLSYQNKIAYLFAVFPLCLLFVAIIFAYLPILSLFTGTKDI